MSPENPVPASESEKKFKPFVPETMEMKEFTWRAILLGLFMTVVLGAANAYLGLRAGITIAATYPAAVIAMAVLRAWKGSCWKRTSPEPRARSANRIAAGAIFTIPAFLIAKAWPSFRPADAYWKSTALIMVGSILGVLFISLVRRVMVEDPELPFPESVAASEIHKAGQRGAQAAKYLFWNIGVGGVVYMLGTLRTCSPRTRTFTSPSAVSVTARSGWARREARTIVAAGGTSTVRRAQREPSLSGRGLHHWLAIWRRFSSLAAFWPGD